MCDILLAPVEAMWVNSPVNMNKLIIINQVLTEYISGYELLLLWFWDDDYTNSQQFSLKSSFLTFQMWYLHRSLLLHNFNQRQQWKYRNYLQITLLYQLYLQFLLLVFHYLTSLLIPSLALLLTSSFRSPPYLLTLLGNHIHQMTKYYCA